MPRPLPEIKSSSVHFRLSEETILKIALRASKTYRTKTSIIAEALDQYFARLEDNVSNK